MRSSSSCADASGLRRPRRVLLLSLLALAPSGAAGCEALGQGDADDRTASGDRLDAAQQAVYRRVTGLARRLDALFLDPNYTEEEADTRLQLRQSVTLSDLEPTSFRQRLDGQLSLPKLSRRLSLTFAGNDEVAPETDDSEVYSDAAEASVDEPELGLRYIFRDGVGRFASLSTSVRFDNPSLVVGPRLRWQHAFGSASVGRISERLRWDTREGFESTTRLELDRRFSSGALLRHQWRVDWREALADEVGIRHQLSAGLSRPLDGQSALLLDWSSRYETEPRRGWVSHVLFARYRRQLGRDWLMIEIGPFLSYRDETDWQPDPGFRLTLDLVFEAQSITETPAAP